MPVSKISILYDQSAHPYCSNGYVKKSSGKIQVMKRDRVIILLSTQSYTIRLYLKRTYKELGYTTEVELVMLAMLALAC